MVAAIARELVVRCRDLTVRANELEREITRLVRQLARTLLELPACGAVSAEKIVGEVVGATRFPSKASFGAGMAPPRSPSGPEMTAASA
jgi:transposase